MTQIFCLISDSRRRKKGAGGGGGGEGGVLKTWYYKLHSQCALRNTVTYREAGMAKW